MKPFATSIMLSPDDIDVRIASYYSDSGETNWIRIGNVGDSSVNGLIIFANEQQLKALHEALRKWDEERVVNVPQNISQLPVNGPLVKS